jgi:hypothetical protein
MLFQCTYHPEMMDTKFEIKTQQIPVRLGGQGGGRGNFCALAYSIVHCMIQKRVLLKLPPGAD